ncbi:MAG TPA: hypothetical protein DCM71_24745 [Runella sp.]|nr:hypothetical protein [Runella sp.]
MEVIATKHFLKQLKSVPPKVQNSVYEVLKKLREANDFQSSGVDYKPLEGQKKGENYYRIRVGGWRIGIEYVEPKVIVITLMSRGDVYKHFPPK